jgi:hypothetical protein
VSFLIFYLFHNQRAANTHRTPVASKSCHQWITRPLVAHDVFFCKFITWFRKKGKKSVSNLFFSSPGGGIEGGEFGNAERPSHAVGESILGGSLGSENSLS